MRQDSLWISFVLSLGILMYGIIINAVPITPQVLIPTSSDEIKAIHVRYVGDGLADEYTLTIKSDIQQLVTLLNEMDLTDGRFDDQVYFGGCEEITVITKTGDIQTLWISGNILDIGRSRKFCISQNAYQAYKKQSGAYLLDHYLAQSTLPYQQGIVTKVFSLETKGMQWCEIEGTNERFVVSDINATDISGTGYFDVHQGDSIYLFYGNSVQSNPKAEKIFVVDCVVK